MLHIDLFLRMHRSGEGTVLIRSLRRGLQDRIRHARDSLEDRAGKWREYLQIVAIWHFWKEKGKERGFREEVSDYSKFQESFTGIIHQIHLLEWSCILLEWACLCIRAMCSRWLGVAFRKYNLSVNAGLGPIKTSERTSKLSTASELYLPLVKEVEGEKQMT